jgi:hypothetical protein
MPGALRLNVSPEQGDEYKLVWGCNTAELLPYSVSGELVRRAAEEVRSILGEFSHLYRKWEIAGHGTFEYSELLPRLAFAGERLCEALFKPSGGNQTSAAEARNFILNDLQEHLSLNIMISGTPLHVPWGFVFRGDPTTLSPATHTPSDFADFWTNLFNISVSFSRTSLGWSKPKQNKFYLVHALHDKLFSNATKSLSAEEQTLIEQIISYELGSFTDWISCRKKWRESQGEEALKQNGDANSIIYIFGHSDGRRICLSEDNSDAYSIDANGFSASFKKNPASQSKTICFVNGCRSGGGFLGDGFIGVTAMHGFQGFIGTEAELSNTFAARFGAEFMRRMCIDGFSVEETFTDLRERSDFFPLSLLYSCYADPEFRVRPRA